jgi:hypothetical protein
MFLLCLYKMCGLHVVSKKVKDTCTSLSIVRDIGSILVLKQKTSCDGFLTLLLTALYLDHSSIPPLA